MLPLRKPGVRVCGEVHLTNSTEFESGEGVACVRYRLAVGLQPGGHIVELEDAAGLTDLKVICGEVQQLIAHLEGVRSVDFAEVVTQRGGLPDVSCRPGNAETI